MRKEKKEKGTNWDVDNVFICAEVQLSLVPFSMWLVKGKFSGMVQDRDMTNKTGFLHLAPCSNNNWQQRCLAVTPLEDE